MLDVMFYGPRQKKYAAIKCTTGGEESLEWEQQLHSEAASRFAPPRLEASNCRVFYCQILELEVYV